MAADFTVVMMDTVKSSRASRRFDAMQVSTSLLLYFSPNRIKPVRSYQSDPWPTLTSLIPTILSRYQPELRG